MAEDTAFYIDTNIFVYAAVNDTETGEKCLNLLKTVQEGKIRGFTSCLTFDEFLWIMKKIKSDSMIEAGNSLLNLNLRFIGVDKEVLYESLEIISEFGLKPRDAIHAATMKLNNIKNIISEDSDFDKVKWIKRRSIVELK